MSTNRRYCIHTRKMTENIEGKVENVGYPAFSQNVFTGIYLQGFGLKGGSNAVCLLSYKAGKVGEIRTKGKQTVSASS